MSFNPFIGGSGGGGTGTDNYNLLSNKPKVNGVELKGDKSFVDLGILFGSSLIAEIDSSTYVVTLTLKDQEGNILGEPQSLDLPLESVVVGGRYDNTTKKVVLTLQNGNTIEFSVADLVDGLQSELSSTNKLNPEFINYNSTHRAVSDSEKTTWNGKQDALTFDNTPTNGSSNPVKSGGVYTALANKVDKVAGKGLSTNDFTDSEKAQISANKAGIGAVANAGAKNVLNVTATSREVNGVTFTVNADSSVTMSGTATARAQFQLAASAPMPNLQGYILSGAVVNDSGATIKFQYSASPWTAFANDTGNGAVIGNYNNANNIAVFIDVPSGATVDNLVFKPMIRNPNIEDDTYVPYGMTNTELTNKKANKTEVAAIANRGSKNILQIKNHAVGDVTETNGFRFTLQADGGILIEDIGTHGGNGDYYLIGQWGNRTTLMDCSDGTYTASLKANDDTASGVSMRIYKAGNSAIVNNVYVNSQANFTGEIAFIFLTAYASASVPIPSGGIVVYPMIRPASIEDGTYQPYAPTNRESYEMILANKAGIGAVANSGSKNRLDVSQTPSTMNAGNITITKGTDGSLTLNGTSTVVADVIIGRITLPAGDYVLSGCAEGGSGGTWLIRIYGDPNITNASHTVGTVFHTEGITNATVRIVVGHNKTLTDAVFKPMICTKAEWDISQEFVSYAPTNRKLYEDKADKTEVAAIANRGSKNLIPDTYTDITRGGLTFTVQDDGTIRVTGGTPTSPNVDFYLIGSFADTDVKYDFTDQNYILSFRVYDTATGAELQNPTGIFCRLYDKSENPTASAYVTLKASGEATFSGKITTSFFTIQPGYGSVGDLTIKVMIRPASIEDSTYVPYAPTNRELYEMILALQSGT